MNNKISEKDKKDWENFLKKNDKLENKDISLKKINRIKIRSIDLHGYTLAHANREIFNFINQSYLDGIKKLIIITGKGLHSENEKNPYVSIDTSMLKYSVPEYVKNNKDLMNKIYKFGEAEIKDGGTGAFYIFLKKNKY